MNQQRAPPSNQIRPGSQKIANALILPQHSASRILRRKVASKPACVVALTVKNPERLSLKTWRNWFGIKCFEKLQHLVELRQKVVPGFKQMRKMGIHHNKPGLLTKCFILSNMRVR